MSALACVLKQLNNIVTGSDIEEDFFTSKSLKENGIEYKVFNESNICDKECIYIISSCYDKNNIEVKKIMDEGYRYYYYSEFINIFFKNIKIGVCGTHGKTTTTSFLADAFGDDICAIIGNGRGIGNLNYKYFIFEACEYRENFLKYDYDYLIINNIEFDHPDYYKDYNEVYEAFRKVSKKSKNIICREDIDINHESKYTFGLGGNCFCRYEILDQNESGYKLKIYINNYEEIVDYPFYGKHMIENLLGVIAVLYLNNRLNTIQKVIDSLNKVTRRMEEIKDKNHIIICDYAHHPTEIKAVLESAKQKYTSKKIIVFFQPHTYSRTLALKDDFLGCFKGADEVFLLDTFTSKRECFNKEKDSEINEIFNGFNRFTEEKLKEYCSREDCVILLLGAGDIDKYKNVIIDK